MSSAALEIRSLEKRFGGIEATANVSLTVATGSLHALIGPNGAGKTTLISQLSGELAPNAGSILYRGIDVTALSTFRRCRKGIARSFQITSLFNSYTTLQNILLAIFSRDRHAPRFWSSVAHRPDSIRKAELVLAQIGLSDQRDLVVSGLSHGQQRQLEVGLALATGADVLLLDEPLAGMGAADASAMIELLRRLKGTLTLVLIEHDMDAVFALADQISVLVYGRLIATGTPDEIRRNPEVRRAYLGEEST